MHTYIHTRRANEAACKKNKQELELLKKRLEAELKEVGDVFSGELDEVNGKLATSDRMLSHMQKYLGKVDAELQTTSEKLEVETYGRAELEELQKALMQERAEIRARIDAEVKNSTALVQHKRNLEDERDAKLSNLRADIEGVDRKIAAEKAASQVCMYACVSECVCVFVCVLCVRVLKVGIARLPRRKLCHTYVCMYVRVYACVCVFACGY
jgi:hypothetical protein